MNGKSEMSWNLRLRSDIRWRQSEEASGKIWIATDPLSRSHFQCSEHDYQILLWLESSTSMDALVKRFHEAFRPRRLTNSALMHFLTQCMNAGIIRGTIPARVDLPRIAAKNLPRSSYAFGFARNCAQMVLQVLQMRFSFGNPDRVIQGIAQPILFLFGWPGFVMSATVMALSVYLVLMRSTEFVNNLPTWQILRSPSGLIGFGIVFVVTRLIHELGHAVACKRFGVPCKDIGLLLSFGMICPYVDITDAWATGSKQKRIIIALGGIYFEAIFAAIAAFAWCFTVESWMHDLFFRVMLVSSVTTLLFNANPFLKYDGYFVLSDVVGMQNIRERSWQAFDALCEGKVVNSLFESVGLSIYFLLALANRISMSLGLAVFIYAVACQWHLAGVGVGLFLLYACSAFILSMGSWVGRPKSTRETTSRRASWLGWSAVLCLVAWTVTMPLPNRFASNGELIVGERRPVHAQEQGVVSQSIAEPTSRVQSGTLILQAENLQFEKERFSAESQLLHARQQLEAAERASYADIRILEKLPLLQTRCRTFEIQRDEVLKRQQSLAISTSHAGYFILEERDSLQSSSRMTPSWDHSVNQRLQKEIATGELLNPGELIGHLYEGDKQRIECNITDEDANLVRIGSAVRVRLNQLPTQLLNGVIEEISQAHHLTQRNRDSKSPTDRPSMIVSICVPDVGVDLLQGGSAEVVFVCEEMSIVDRVVDAGLRNLRWR